MFCVTIAEYSDKENVSEFDIEDETNYKHLNEEREHFENENKEHFESSDAELDDKMLDDGLRCTIS